MIKNLRFFLLSIVALLAGTAMAEVTDVLNNATFGNSGTNYADFSNVKVSSQAVYAGNSAGSNNTIQLRSKNNAGIVTTASGGKVLSITVKFNSSTAAERVLSIYGKNTAYTAASDLYGDAAGTLIKEVALADGAEQTVTLTDDYTFIGFRSKSGALYLDEVSITWDGEAGGGGTPEPEPEPVAADTLTVAQALAIIDALENGKTTAETYFVKGYVVGDPDFQRNGSGALYGNVNFTMADEQGGTTLLTVYRAKGFDNANFTEETISQLKADDVVVLNGKLQKYVKNEEITPELTGGHLVTVNGTVPQVKPVDLKTAANIGAFLALTAGDEATLTLTDAQVTYVNVNNNKTELFVRDATGAIDLYDLGIEATVGQKLNGTVNVKLGANGGFVAAVKGTNELSSTLAVTDGGDVTATAIDMAEAAAYYCDYVVLTGVVLNSDGKAENEDGDALALYDRFNLGLIGGLKKDGTKYDLYGLMYDGGTSYGPELVVTKATLAGGGEIVDDPVVFTGAGTLENPFTVADLLQLNPDKITDYLAADSIVWVKGVIIGSIKSNALEETPSQVSNMAIAAQAGETDYAATIPVELKNKTDFRTNLNVVDNPANIGKEVLLRGNIIKYFSKTGVKNLSDYVLDNEQYTVTGISEVKASKRFQGAIYNLSGQRVKTPAKGLFILNGKKYFVK